jgi:hypothetical protein
MDVARWYLGADAIAPRTMSIGGRLGYDDDGETPNTQLVWHDYDGAPLIFETRGLPKSKEAQKDWGKNMESPTNFPEWVASPWSSPARAASSSPTPAAR